MSSKCAGQSYNIDRRKILTFFFLLCYSYSSLNMIRRFLLKILFNGLALYIVAILAPGISFRGDWESYLVAGFVFAVLNSLIKPILKSISFPLIALSFGLFSIIINMAMLWILAQIIPNLSITGFWAYFWGSIIISVLNFLINLFPKAKKT